MRARTKIKMRRALIMTMVGFALPLCASGVLAAEPSRSAKQAKDPNEKVCETHGVLGSRLAVRRVCATGAEWDDRGRRERDIVDRTQTQRCAIDPLRASAVSICDFAN